MTTNRFIQRALPVLSMGMLLWLSPIASQAGEKATATMLPASAESLGAVAADSVEDSFQACLARIPKDASSGQRMIAEQGCQRDETTRKSIHAAPRL